MTYIALRADFFDASALVKVFANEPASQIVRSYWRSRATKYTTPYCFYEALNILKSKWKYQNELTVTEYLNAAYELTAWYGASSAKLDDLDFSDPHTFAETRALSDRSGLDLSDAFQIVSIKRGYYSALANDSKTVLVTADSALAVVAGTEGIKAWYVMNEPPP